MHVVADTESLISDGVITREQAAEIGARARQAMMALGVHAVLCIGILSATLGLIFWLADASAVAISGSMMLGGGLAILMRGQALFAMFGNAFALIGAGMLIGGAGLELVDKHSDIAGPIMMLGGGVIAGVAGRAFLYGGLTARFVCGAILLMGSALHLSGLAFWLSLEEFTGWPVVLFYLYATALIASAGWITNVRLVTALAIVPFAQALDTGTFYFHAAYVFYSPESTLSILQMVSALAALVWVASRAPERTARHARVLSVMVFVVANLCALVGSLWGDIVGLMIWGPGSNSWSSNGYETHESWRAARDAFEASTLVISEHVYTVVWAVVLAALIFWAAQRGNRGVFNTAVTFAAIHGYTQAFESFWDEPMIYVIGGFAALPLAFAMWRLNLRFAARQAGGAA